MIRNFEYLIVFTSAPGVLPEQNYRYWIKSRKVNEIKGIIKIDIILKERFCTELRA